MAGVAMSPTGEFFVGDSDRPEQEDISHLEDLRIQATTPDLTVHSQIFTVLCESEKDKVEAWRRSMGPLDDQALGSPVSRRSLSVEHDVSELFKRVSLQEDSEERVYTPELASPLCVQDVALPAGPKPVPMRCFGLTFIADVENHCIQVLRADGKHVRRFGSFGKEPGQFNAMQSLVVDDKNMLIYVADTYNHRVQVFEFHSSDASDMKVVRIIGGFGKDNGLFNYPVGIALDAGANTLVVADTGNDRIQILTNQGEHIRTFGLLGKHETNGQGEPLLKLPHDVVVIAGKIYVTDLGNHRIQVLTMDGEHVRSLGSHGTKTGMFVHPRRLMRGPAALLLVSDQVRTWFDKPKPLLQALFFHPHLASAFNACRLILAFMPEHVHVGWSARCRGSSHE